MERGDRWLTEQQTTLAVEPDEMPVATEVVRMMREWGPIKAITLHQPWATLIALGEKRVETRSWATSYRGPIAIHAAKRKPVDLEEPEFREALEAAGLTLETLPLGAIVATAILKDCVMFGGLMEEQVQQGRVTWQAPHESLYGDFSPGRYGWVLEEVEPLAEPVPARGFQGLWNWNGKGLDRD